MAKKTNLRKSIGLGICILFSLFQLGTSLFGYFPDLRQRAIFLGFGLSIALLMFPATKKVSWFRTTTLYLDLVLIAVVLVACANAYTKYLTWLTSYLGTTTFDVVLSVLMFLIIFETSRRTTGVVLAILMAVMMFYTWLGAYIPGSMGHQGIPLEQIFVLIYQTMEGMWNSLVGTLATEIAPYFILAAILLLCGGGKTFVDIALKITGRIRGGPALAGVVGSGLFGTISGSGVVNVATVGQLTIPLMKKLGYQPHFAGGVESVSSIGGMLMPPVMGAGAFLMAQFLGIPYVKICGYALIPALLFYLGVFTGVRWQAVKSDLAPVPKEQIPSARSILTYNRIVPLVGPIIILLFLLFDGWTAGLAAAYSCIAAAILFLFSDFSITNVKKRALILVECIAEGGKSLANIAPMIACAAIIVMLINASGLGFKVAVYIMSLAGSWFFAALLMTAVVAIVLGMGLPVVAAYVLAAAICAPVLGQLGVSPLTAHMFVFYFSLLAGITPPVCMVVYVGAATAGASWLRTAWTAIRLGAVAYLMPFAFIYNPALLLTGSVGLIAITVIAVAFATVVLASGFWGYVPVLGLVGIISRLILVIAGGMLLAPLGYMWAISLGLIVLALLLRKVAAPVRIVTREESQAFAPPTA